MPAALADADVLRNPNLLAPATLAGRGQIHFDGVVVTLGWEMSPGFLPGYAEDAIVAGNPAKVAQR